MAQEGKLSTATLQVGELLETTQQQNIETNFVPAKRAKRNSRKALNVRNNSINILVKSKLKKKNVILQDKEKRNVMIKHSSQCKP